MITIKGTKTLDKEQQWVFLEVEVDGKVWPFTYVAPAELAGADLQKYVDGQEAFYQSQVRQNLADFPDGSTLPPMPPEDPVIAELKARIAALEKR